MPNPHFQTVSTVADAEALIDFAPRLPAHAAGAEMIAVSVHVRDHKLRELAIGQRSLEVKFASFNISQSRKGREEARRWAIEVAYGQNPKAALVAGHDGRVYELGPPPAPDDADPRDPSVVTWADGEMFYLVASDSLDAAALSAIAASMYA